MFNLMVLLSCPFSPLTSGMVIGMKCVSSLFTKSEDSATPTPCFVYKRCSMSILHKH